MRFFVLTALLLAGALAFSARASNRLGPSIGVFVDFEALPSPGTVTAMEREVASIMSPSGLIFSWRMLSGGISPKALLRIWLSFTLREPATESLSPSANWVRPSKPT